MHWLQQLPSFAAAAHLAESAESDGYATLMAETYREVRSEFLSAYERLPEGGLLAGAHYVDGILDGRVFGAKTAVNELSDELRLQVRLTLDRVPAWWAVKPAEPDRQPFHRPRIALVTAHNTAHQTLAALSSPNKKRYCERHGYSFCEYTAGFDQTRPAAWSKILFIKRALRDYDWVFWSDADSLIMNGEVRLEDIIWNSRAGDDEGHHVIVPHDEPGEGVTNVNTGSWLVKRSEWAEEFLDEVWAQEQFVQDRLWENRAVIHLLYEYDLSHHVRIVAQRHLNSYPRTYQKGHFVLHFPDRPLDTREQSMRIALQFSSVY